VEPETVDEDDGGGHQNLKEDGKGR